LLPFVLVPLLLDSHIQQQELAKAHKKRGNAFHCSLATPFWSFKVQRYEHTVAFIRLNTEYMDRHSDYSFLT